MFKTIIFIIFIIMLFITSIISIILLIYALKLIKISTHLKAKQYAKLNDFCEKNKIVFLGDSLTEFYQTDEFLYHYHIYNRGIASDTTDGVLKRLQDNVIIMEPSKIFIQIGTNDLRNKKTRSIDYITNNIKKIIEILENSLPNTKLYLISLYPVNHNAKKISKFFTYPRKNSMIKLINSTLYDYSENNKVTFIDVFNHLTDEYGNLKNEYTVEGLHISFEGYQKITEILIPYINE